MDVIEKQISTLNDQVNDLCKNYIESQSSSIVNVQNSVYKGFTKMTNVNYIVIIVIPIIIFVVLVYVKPKFLSKSTIGQTTVSKRDPKTGALTTLFVPTRQDANGMTLQSPNYTKILVATLILSTVCLMTLKNVFHQKLKFIS